MCHTFDNKIKRSLKFTGQWSIADPSNILSRIVLPLLTGQTLSAQNIFIS